MALFLQAPNYDRRQGANAVPHRQVLKALRTVAVSAVAVASVVAPSACTTVGCVGTTLRAVPVNASMAQVLRGEAALQARLTTRGGKPVVGLPVGFVLTPTLVTGADILTSVHTDANGSSQLRLDQAMRLKLLPASHLLSRTGYKVIFQRISAAPQTQYCQSSALARLHITA